MPNRSSQPWTDEEDEALRRLWAEGWSAAQIAKALGTGRTRNSVIGRAHRKRFPLRADPHRSYQKNRRAPHLNPHRRKDDGVRVTGRCYQSPSKVKRQIAKAAPKLRQRVEPVEPLNVPFAELQAFQCKAVTDDTRFAQRFCGHVREDGSPYCEAHAALYAAPAQGKAA